MLSYAEVLDQLNHTLPMFSRQGSGAFKKGLDNINRLCAGLHHPQNKFPSVHIAGTNGKGSTSHLLAAALQQAGYKTGLYTSPHLTDLRERFRIDGEPVSESFVIRFMDRAATLINEIHPSYFELTVAMAFTAFADAAVDIAVIETGMGGRLDSTNIITPVLSVITNIGLDHTDILGDTLEKIALEKAGIIKENVPVVIGEAVPETEKIFIQTGFARKAPVHFAEALWDIIPAGSGLLDQHYKAVPKSAPEIIPFKTDLLGAFQAANIRTALVATQLLDRMGWNMAIEDVLESFASVKTTTGLKGRWDWVQSHPNIVLDVAHNAAGLSFLMDNLRRLPSEPSGKLHIICGFVKDKDIAAALSCLPTEARYYFTQAQIPRAMPASSLQELAAAKALTGAPFASVPDALDAARPALQPQDTLLITGSFFIVGEAMAALQEAE